MMIAYVRDKIKGQSYLLIPQIVTQFPDKKDRTKMDKISVFVQRNRNSHEELALLIWKILDITR